MCSNLSFFCEIIAQETPAVLHQCRKCKTTMPFYCSEKFRVNAHRKRLDVWLIYNCRHCDGTWNYPILSGARADKIDRELYRKFMDNDRDAAWAYAFDTKRLRRLCSGVMTNIKYALSCEPVHPEAGSMTIILTVKHDFGLRLDKLLTELVGIFKSELCQMAETGRLATDPQIQLKGKVRDGMRIFVK